MALDCTRKVLVKAKWVRSIWTKTRAMLRQDNLTLHGAKCQKRPINLAGGKKGESRAS